MNNNKKLRIALIILILLVIIVLLIAIAITNTNEAPNENTQSSGYIDAYRGTKEEIETKYETNVITAEYRTLTNEERLRIDDMIDKVIGYINNKNYSEMFNSLTSEYKDIRFASLNEFKTYIDNLFGNYEYKCLTYKVLGGICEVTLANENDSRIDIYLAGYRETPNPNIYFEYISSIRNSKAEFYLSDVLFSVRYSIVYDDKETIYIYLKNNTNKNVNINIEEFTQVSIIAGSRSEIEIKEPKSIEIPANGTGSVELELKERTGILKPKFIEYKIKVDDNVYNYTYTFELLEDE